ncbi:MAG: S8 family peptidase, partial [Bacteroidota bacterium]|nr:S8 family peptidase [Bacteroidota bacterium]
SGGEVVAVSRWLNAVSVRAPLPALIRIARLPQVAAVQPVRRWQNTLPAPASLASIPPYVNPHGLDYGDAFPQLSVIKVPAVHDIWIDGTDITVGMLDNGFRWRTHEAMLHADVRGEFDVINKDSVTENEEGDLYGQDAHGTVTFSALASFKEGRIIGPAFNAAFYLAKTEVNGSETQIEEDYWVEGIEWLEARGASIVSVSLGYSDWDDGTGYSHQAGDFDGRTAVTTRAAVEAMRRGIVVVTAMGNEGPSAATLIAPADADSIISVGAMDFSGSVAGFSSRGPTSDLRIKPDVCAPGVSVVSAGKSSDDRYESSSGTSMATPLAAGVAALVRSARPELTAVQVRDVLRETASDPQSPDNAAGWGMINAWDALLFHGMVISTNPKYYYNGRQTTVMTWVVSQSPVRSDDVRLTWLHPTEGPKQERMTLMRPLSTEADGSGLYTVTLPEIPANSKISYYITAGDSRETRTSPYGAPERTHVLRIGDNHMLGADKYLPAAFALHQNYPNPWTPSESGNTLIPFEVPMPGGNVRLRLYDMAGRLVATLVDGYRGAGLHTATLQGSTLSTGIYFYALTSGDTQIMRRMLILQ